MRTGHKHITRRLIVPARRAVLVLFAVAGWASVLGGDFTAPVVPLQILETHMTLAQRQLQSETELREMIETALVSRDESATVDQRLAEVRVPGVQDPRADVCIRAGFPGHGISGSGYPRNAAPGGSVFALPRGSDASAPHTRFPPAAQQPPAPDSPVITLFYYSIRNGYIPASTGTSGVVLAGFVDPTLCRVSRGVSARSPQPERTV